MIMTGTKSDTSVRHFLREAARRLSAAGVPSPTLDAELLLAHVLELDRAAVLRGGDRELTPPELEAFDTLVSRRARLEPVAYLTGSKEFFGREFRVTKDVLIPRPDTETLVELALKVIPPDARVLDIGAGSGAVAVTLAAERPDIRVVSTDLSMAAIDVARENADELNTGSQVELVLGDLFPASRTVFDAIVSNPPYIAPDEELPVSVRDYEPALALFAGEGGLEVIRRILAGAAQWLKPGGWLLVEIGSRQGGAVRALACERGWEQVEILPDLAGHDRVLKCRRPAGTPLEASGG